MVGIRRSAARKKYRSIHVRLVSEGSPERLVACWDSWVDEYSQSDRFNMVYRTGHDETADGEVEADGQATRQ